MIGSWSRAVCKRGQPSTPKRMTLMSLNMLSRIHLDGRNSIVSVSLSNCASSLSIPIDTLVGIGLLALAWHRFIKHLIYDCIAFSMFTVALVISTTALTRVSEPSKRVAEEPYSPPSLDMTPIKPSKGCRGSMPPGHLIRASCLVGWKGGRCAV